MLDAVRIEIDRLRGRRSFVGMTVALGSASESRDYAFGVSCLDPVTFATPDSLFETGSTGKSVTAALVLRLCDSGSLDLDAELGAILPEVPVGWSKVRIRHLLNHRSGIVDYLDLTSGDEPLDNHAAWKLAARTCDVAKPGQYYAYSNTNYCLLGNVISVVGGRPYPEAVRQLLGVELGIKGLILNDLSYESPDRATGYLDPSTARGTVPRESALTADGPLLGSAAGLMAWTRRFWMGDVVSLRRFQPSVISLKRRERYRFGWRLKRSQFGPIAYHAGGTPGFESFMAWNLGTRTGFVCLGNSELVDLSVAFKRVLFD